VQKYGVFIEIFLLLPKSLQIFMETKFDKLSSIFRILFTFAVEKQIVMTAFDLQSNTMQLLQRFDKTDVSLWQKVLDALVAIYQEEEQEQAEKRAQQKAKIRQMVGVFEQCDTDDWKQAKEDYLNEKYAS
jgi:hypothetical protein